jgi:peroxiredoxin
MRVGLFAIFLVGGTGCVPRLYSPPDTDGGGDCAWDAPSNDWSCWAPPACMEGEGFSPGQTMPDFRLLDQNGAQVSLWQFYGDVIVWDLSTIWCAPCQELAGHAEELYQSHKDRGLTYLTVLAQDLDGAPPDQDDLELWASNFGLTSPVLADPLNGYSAPAIPDNQYPVVLVIDRQMKVMRKVPPPYSSDENILAAVEPLLDEAVPDRAACPADTDVSP